MAVIISSNRRPISSNRRSISSNRRSISSNRPSISSNRWLISRNPACISSRSVSILESSLEHTRQPNVIMATTIPAEVTNDGIHCTLSGYHAVSGRPGSLLPGRQFHSTGLVTIARRWGGRARARAPPAARTAEINTAAGFAKSQIRGVLAFASEGWFRQPRLRPSTVARHALRIRTGTVGKFLMFNDEVMKIVRDEV